MRSLTLTSFSRPQQPFIILFWQILIVAQIIHKQVIKLFRVYCCLANLLTWVDLGHCDIHVGHQRPKGLPCEYYSTFVHLTLFCSAYELSAQAELMGWPVVRRPSVTLSRHLLKCRTNLHGRTYRVHICRHLGWLALRHNEIRSHWLTFWIL